MARALSALLLVLGCANPARMTPPPHLDFGLDDLAMAEPPDLSVPPPDLSTAPPDLSMPSPKPDLAETADLLPTGCDDAGTTGHLFLAAVGSSNALLDNRFTEAGGWNAYEIDNLPAVASVAETLEAGRPLVVARQTDSALSTTAADSCSQQFAALQSIGFNLKTSVRPGALPGAVVFRGSADSNLYYMYRPSTLWLGPVKQNAMSASGTFALVRFENELEVYYSDGGKLSFGKVQSPNGGGPAAQILTLTTAQPPAAVLDGGGRLHVVFVGTDTNLYWIWRDANGAWDNANLHQLCDGQAGCLIDTNLPISLALDSAGVPIAAWVGINAPHKVYTSRLLSAAGPQYWDAVQTASGSCSTKDCETTVGPALATGLGSAQAELVFVSDMDGRARHARLLPVDMGAGWGEPVSISGPNLLDTPALITEP
jgi:hypothetical protein